MSYQTQTTIICDLCGVRDTQHETKPLWVIRKLLNWNHYNGKDFCPSCAVEGNRQEYKKLREPMRQTELQAITHACRNAEQWEAYIANAFPKRQELVVFPRNTNLAAWPCGKYVYSVARRLARVNLGEHWPPFGELQMEARKIWAAAGAKAQGFFVPTGEWKPSTRIM